MSRWLAPVFVLALAFAPDARGAVGDPQVATDDPWYPGELSCSTFERLFATQAAVYKRVTGRDCTSDEDKALAAWLWRNTHYFHAEEGAADLWGKGFKNDSDGRGREYWTGLFAHGYGLCGTTHAQWVAEMEALLGHGRGRDLGCSGHNSFEVFLKGGAYGDGPVGAARQRPVVRGVRPGGQATAGLERGRARLEEADRPHVQTRPAARLADLRPPPVRLHDVLRVPECGVPGRVRRSAAARPPAPR